MTGIHMFDQVINHLIFFSFLRMVIGYQASPTKTKTVILVASALCGVTVLTQQKIPAPPVHSSVVRGFL